MISLKNLIKMARKWQKKAAQSRKKITFSTSNNNYNGYASFVVNKGHFVVYTTDDKRFAMPLSYLNHNILRELFKMSEEEFGLSSDGPIRMTCDSSFMDYVIKLVRRGIPKDLEKALIISIETSRSSLLVSSCHHGLDCQQIIVSG